MIHEPIANSLGQTDAQGGIVIMKRTPGIWVSTSLYCHWYALTAHAHSVYYNEQLVTLSVPLGHAVWGKPFIYGLIYWSRNIIKFTCIETTGLCSCTVYALGICVYE